MTLPPRPPRTGHTRAEDARAHTHAHSHTHTEDTLAHQARPHLPTHTRTSAQARARAHRRALALVPRARGNAAAVPLRAAFFFFVRAHFDAENAPKRRGGKKSREAAGGAAGAGVRGATRRAAAARARAMVRVQRGRLRLLDPFPLHHPRGSLPLRACGRVRSCARSV